MRFKTFSGLLQEISQEIEKKRERKEERERNLKKERNTQTIKNPLLGDSLALNFGRNIFSDLKHGP